MNERSTGQRSCVAGRLLAVFGALTATCLLFAGSAFADSGGTPGALCAYASVCPGVTTLTRFNPTHYGIQVGQGGTFQIIGATDVSGPTVTVYIKHSTLGVNEEVTGTLSGSTITFEYTATARYSCQTSAVAYGDVGNVSTNDIENDGVFDQTPQSASGFAFLDANGDVIQSCNGSTLPDSPTVSTTILDAAGNAVTSVPADGTVHDTANLVNAGGTNGTPQGTVSFTWFTNGNCNPNGSAAGSAAVNASGLADGSTSKGPLAPGDYSFNAHYVSSDPSKWNDSFSACEPLHVAAPAVDALTASKDANPSFDRAFTWKIEKSVDQTRAEIAAGGAATFNYTVSVTKSEPTDSGWQVTGTISVNNPNAMSVSGVNVTDSIDDANASCSVTGGTNTSLPGSSVTGFDYICTYSGPPASGSETNTASVSWGDQQMLSGFVWLAGGSLAPTAPVDWSTPSTVTDDSITVSDSAQATPLGTTSQSTTYQYSVDRQGVAGTCTDYDNTASFVADTTGATGSASQTVKVCVGKDATVAKSADPSFTRTYSWTVAKSVDKTRVAIADGGTATFNYTVDVTRSSGVDSDWKVTGSITVTNPNDWESITLTSLADAIDNGGSCSITSGDISTPIAANGSATYGYTCTYASAPTPAGFTNKATAGWDKDAAHTPSGSASGTASGTFGDPTSVVDESASIDDSVGGHLGTANGSTSFTYSVDRHGVAGTCTNYDNTATFTTNDTGSTGSASQTVTVCVGSDLSVKKTAATSFSRVYLWKIVKSVDKTKVTQASGSATFNYTVQVDQTGVSDSNWKVSGTITVSNPNDWEAITAGVGDSLPNCTLSQSSVTVPAGGSVDVTYSCDQSDGSSGTNTATATWDKDAYFTPSGSASGSATFAFGAPSSTTNKTINVTDSYAGALGSLTGTDSSPFTSHTYTYSRTIPVLANCNDYPNTATITQTGQSSSQTVRVCGPARTGALTMGFWQNKNGQGIIAGANQASLLAYLTGFAPFANATGPLTTYTTNIIKAANASGASMNAMLKAQMLATALDVYFGGGGGGNQIGASVVIGNVVIDLTNVPPIGNTSSAFGGATSLTVSQILAYAASQSNAGGVTWYGNVKTTQELAKDVFDAINNGWAYSV